MSAQQTDEQPLCPSARPEMHGAMLCDFPHSALAPYLSEMLGGQMRSYPLAPWLLLPLSICLALFAHALATRRSAARRET